MQAKTKEILVNKEFQFGECRVKFKKYCFNYGLNLTLILLLIFIISNKEKSDLQALIFYSKF